MAKDFVDLRIYFEREEEDDYTFFIPVQVKRKRTSLTEEQLDAVAESAGQSDRYQVGVCNALLLALGEEEAVAVEW